MSIHSCSPCVGFVLFASCLLAAAKPLSQTPWGELEDDVSYMNLLQVNADKRNSVQIDDRGSITLKQIRPYYHTSAEIQEEAKRLSQGCGGAMSIETHSENNIDIDLIKIRSPDSTPVNRVFILFGEHSRELISPESGLRFLHLLCGEAHTGTKLDISNLLKDNEFQLVLNGNPSSRKKVENGEFCLRTNPNGVDLNRNWDEKWEKSNQQSAVPDDTNSGPRPFSEPETRIFKKLVQKFRPTTFLTVHSGTRGMYMPWAFDMEHKAQLNAPLMLSVLKDLDASHCQCPYGAAGKEVGYPCPGTCLDWVYSRLKTPYVFAFEIYTNDDRDNELKKRWKEKLESGGLKLLQSGNHLGHGHFHGLFDTFTSDFVHTRSGDANSQEDEEKSCFGMFNPETEMSYNSTVQNWAVAYLEMADRIAKELKKDNSPLRNMDKTKILHGDTDIF